MRVTSSTNSPTRKRLPSRKAATSPGEKGERGKEDDDAPGKKDKEGAAEPKKVPEKDEEGGGTKILWKLVPGSPYEWVFIEADRDEKIAAVFGIAGRTSRFLSSRPAMLQGPIHDANQVAWDALRPKRHHRIVANGANQAASQVSISLVSVRTNGMRRPSRE